MNIRIDKILLREGAHDYDQSYNILNKLNKVPVERIDDNSTGQIGPLIDMDKKSLYLLSYEGELFKPCPGTKEYICCGYNILHIGTNCPLDCSYCILQAYFNQPSLRVFVNLERELADIGKLIDSTPEKIYRIGTGEFTDSLALDPIVGWSSIIPRFFAKRKNAILEFKTKTDHVEGLLDSPYRDRIIISWSLNSPHIATREEHGAPSLEKRLKAAAKCQDEGYILGFHFDPLICYDGWREDYLKTIEMMDKYIDPDGIIWISFGCLRFMPNLKAIIRKRHLGTHILDGEFILGLDGKMRYFKPIRIEMYSFLKENIEKWSINTGNYLCMESDEVWSKSLGWSPGNSEGLSFFLDNRVREIFKINS